MGDQKEDTTQAVREATDDGVLKIVKSEKVGPNQLSVIVEGTNLERLTTPEARALAYEQRLKHGMADAGIEALTGTFVPDEEYKAAAEEQRNVARWQREFKLVNML